MLLIFTPEITPRIQFTFEFVFNDLLRMPFKLTNQKSYFYRYEGPVLNYSPQPLNKGIWIQSNGLLTQKGISYPDPKPGQWNKLPILFKTGPEPDLPFDNFAGSFYLISRYEEYLDFKPDHVGRFPQELSVAVKNDFLEIPVVDLWAARLKKMLKIRYPELQFNERSYSFISTIDIDQAWAYLHKGLARHLAGGIKNSLKGDIRDVKRRTQTLSRLKKDPFDNYEYLFEILQGIDNGYFIQVGKYSKFDKNHSGRHPAMRKLIHKLDKNGKIGIHPSVRSGQRRELDHEISLLSNIVGKEIVKSRQHYLYLRFPKTYRNLIQNGVKEDYSMGYPYKPGFRAGTATPFMFYDLLEEKVTDLKIIPFQVMDSCLNYNMGLSTQEAKELFAEYIKKVKKVNGTFVSIWHNSSLGDEGEWEGWRAVFEYMLSQAK